MKVTYTIEVDYALDSFFLQSPEKVLSCGLYYFRHNLNIQENLEDTGITVKSVKVEGSIND